MDYFDRAKYRRARSGFEDLLEDLECFFASFKLRNAIALECGMARTKRIECAWERQSVLVWEGIESIGEIHCGLKVQLFRSIIVVVTAADKVIDHFSERSLVRLVFLTGCCSCRCRCFKILLLRRGRQ